MANGRAHPALASRAMATVVAAVAAAGVAAVDDEHGDSVGIAI